MLAGTRLPSESQTRPRIESNDVLTVHSLFASCMFQLLWGKVFKYFLLKRAFLVAIAIFEIGSIICAIAPVSAVLILGRAIAGVGSAGVVGGYGMYAIMMLPQLKTSEADPVV